MLTTGQELWRRFVSGKHKQPTDWRKRFDKVKAPHNVMLSTDFAGIASGTLMHIASPGAIANYCQRVPIGETRKIERMRHELARAAHAQATCPVTTAIYLRIVAEAALMDMADGKPVADVVPFWRVVDPDSKVAGRLSCERDFIAGLRDIEKGSRSESAGTSP
jgi:hypothetical protein